MAYWLLKSEPEEWSWDDQVEAGAAPWNGVRNHQAAGNMRAMQVGDRAFFYHSGKRREVVGIVEVVRPFYPDPEDAGGRFGIVDVKALEALPAPVSLERIKQSPELAGMVLLRQSRLSVSPVSSEQWSRICALGGLPGGARAGHQE